MHHYRERERDIGTPHPEKKPSDLHILMICISLPHRCCATIFQAKKANGDVSDEFSQCLEKLQTLVGIAVAIEVPYACVSRCAHMIKSCLYVCPKAAYQLMSICGFSWHAWFPSIPLLCRQIWASQWSARRIGRLRRPWPTMLASRCRGMQPRSCNQLWTPPRCWGTFDCAVRWIVHI